MPSLWRVQARWWRRHTPTLEQRGAKRPVCEHCRQSWPCHSWACWDGQLGEAISRPGLPDRTLDGGADVRPITVAGGTDAQRALAPRDERSAA